MTPSANADTGHPRRHGLRHASDLQSLAYLLGAPALAAWQWHAGVSALLYSVMVVLWIGIGVINHNHAHLPMWRGRQLNRATTLWVSALQGHPAFVFHPAHNANHHRWRHGPLDVARTYRFAGGDTNTLWGYVLHPFQAAVVLYPLFFNHLHRLRHCCRVALRRAVMEIVVVLALWAVCLWLDPWKTLWLVAVPQCISLHWLLGANYFQHAHADGSGGEQARWNYARNFEGAVNTLYFNIGLHTAHHEHPRTHWSDLPKLHRELRHRIDPRLIERGLVSYMLRVFVGGLFFPSLRSRSLMTAPAPQPMPEMHSTHARTHADTV